MRIFFIAAFVFILPILKGSGPFSTEPDDLKGLLRIKIGNSFEEVKDLLEKKPVVNYFSKKHFPWMNKEEKDEFMKEEGERTYCVKKSLPEYSVFFETKVEFIEVSFSEEMKIESVAIFMKKTEENGNIVRSGMAYIFGSVPCAMGVDEPSFYCVWEQDGFRAQVYDFNGEGMATYDEYVYCVFKIDY